MMTEPDINTVTTVGIQLIGGWARRERGVWLPIYALLCGLLSRVVDSSNTGGHHSK